MSDQTALTQELTILAQEDAEGFQRIIDGLEEKTINGLSYYTCGYGKYCNGVWLKAAMRAAEMIDALRCEDSTPMEDILHECRPGLPLPKKQQELLVLCKQILEGVRT